eukprot:scaffold16189_cov125-Cylindrotheca_fusiformis.AAC.9
MNQHLQEDPTDIKRIRWHVPRGSKIHDYPAEYEILTLNPPSPFKPFMPKKDVRKALNKYIQDHRPMDHLARKYLNEKKRQGNSGEPTSGTEYYRRLLGSKKAPKIDSAMGSKSAIMNRAYAVAVKQYQLMRTETMSEKEALDKVEELLQQEDYKEKTRSRTRAESVTGHAFADKDAENRAETVYPSAIPFTQQRKDSGDADISMLYTEDQRAFEGMISWTHRLQAVAYRQWTVGASTALDHWIAKRVLGMSEETWLELLEGDSPNLMGRGRDIVMARHALFPETLFGEEESSLENGDSSIENVEDDMDALLATLGGWNTDEDRKSKSSSGFDDKILELTTQLQDWRTRQLEVPYEEWSVDEQKGFKNWLEDYVTTLTPQTGLAKVDMNSTRKALLESPPQSKDESDTFWDSIRDETAAEVFLQQLRAEKKDADHPFWELDYSRQLERLVNLGAIRDIADEYTTESERGKFLTRYGDYLLEGLKLDHLVGDPTGPIRGSDLGEALMKKYDLSPSDRFHLESIPYGTDQFGTKASRRARDIYRSWNLLKAGRAHYEEKLFKKGLLGLSYSKKVN